MTEILHEPAVVRRPDIREIIADRDIPKEMKRINPEKDRLHGEWNYKIKPQI